MNHSTQKVRSLIFGLLLLAFSALLTGCVQNQTLPSIKVGSVEARRSTFEALQSAWESRPMELTASNARREMHLINQTAKFVVHVNHREIGRAATDLYRMQAREFFKRYQTEDVLAGKNY